MCVCVCVSPPSPQEPPGGREGRPGPELLQTASVPGTPPSLPHSPHPQHGKPVGNCSPTPAPTFLVALQVQQHNGHVFISYQVSIPQSCEQCLSYIWLMDKALLCNGECPCAPAPTVPPDLLADPPPASPPCPLTPHHTPWPPQTMSLTPCCAAGPLPPATRQIFLEHCPSPISLKLTTPPTVTLGQSPVLSGPEAPTHLCTLPSPGKVTLCPTSRLCTHCLPALSGLPAPPRAPVVPPPHARPSLSTPTRTQGEGLSPERPRQRDEAQARPCSLEPCDSHHSLLSLALFLAQSFLLFGPCARSSPPPHVYHQSPAVSVC